MSRETIRALLSGGTRRSTGRANEVAANVAQEPVSFRYLIALLHDPEDPVVRMRAADAAEKASRQNPTLLRPHKPQLLALLAESDPQESIRQEIRWHLAQMIPRLQLTPAERRGVIASLELYLRDRSSIVRTCAMQALAELALQEPGTTRNAIADEIRILARTGTPAMKARGRKLLEKLARKVIAPGSPEC